MEDVLLEQPHEMSWVRYSRWVLWFCGGMYLLLGTGMAVFYVVLFTMGTPDDLDLVFGIVMGGVMFFFCCGFGAVNFVAAWGLGRARKWAWFATLVLGCLYLPSGCLPLGAVLVYGMLNDPVRKAFLD